jgi:hypothetical protein
MGSQRQAEVTGQGLPRRRFRLAADESHGDVVGFLVVERKADALAGRE